MHGHPDLLAGISPELFAAPDGCSPCFKFAALDDGLIEELERLVARGFEVYMARWTRPPKGRARKR